MWSQIIGHGRQIELLKKALSSNKLAGAYLFTGPRGAGKRRVADAFAIAIACEVSPENSWEACGKCAGCLKAIAGTHPDLFTVAAESAMDDGSEQESAGKKKTKSDRIKIEQIRELQSRLNFHSLEARAKLAIIDDADKMTEEAANSFLKTLEEPPPSTHFVLISSTPHKLLPTIRSRCQQISFSPLPIADVAARLVASGRMTNTEAERIARLSGGSLGLALSIDPDFIAGILGRMGALANGGTSADVAAAAEEWSHDDPANAKLIFDILASFYSDVLKFKATGDAASLIHPEAAISAPKMPESKATRAIEEISRSRQALDTTANKQLMFEHLLFTLLG